LARVSSLPYSHTKHSWHKAFWRQAPGDQDLDLNVLRKEKKRKMIHKMLGVQSNSPGSLGEKLRHRKELEAMVDQVEWETAVFGTNEGKGRIPALFFTFTVQIYKWEQLNRLIRRFYGLSETVEAEQELLRSKDVKKKAEGRRLRDKRFFQEAADNPAIVEWYVSLKLEMMLHLTRQVINRCDGASGGRHGRRDPMLDEYWSTFEWSAGGTAKIGCVSDGLYPCRNSGTGQDVNQHQMSSSFSFLT
jgi:hypothetical protein